MTFVSAGGGSADTRGTDPLFHGGDFAHAPEAEALCCPNAVSTRRRTHNRVDAGWRYAFAHDQRAACPLQARCLKHLAKANGRSAVANRQTARKPTFGHLAVAEGNHPIWQ